jgi:tRNA pseudouridine13 synthase
MTEPALTPFAPPIFTPDLPGTGGAIGPDPTDFQVDEVPLYAPAGEGEHLYVRFRKTLLTTRDAVREIARAAGVRPEDVGVAGMKDKQAVTTQWASVPERGARPADAWKLPPGLEVLEVTLHKNKLRTGHLLGNRFRIRLVGVEPGAHERALALCSRLVERGVPNYFGAQRFGRNGENLGKALAWIRGEAGEGERRRVPGFERKLYSSVLQAEVYNRYATARVAEGLDRPLAGEVVRLDGSGATFVVEDVDREIARWSSRDLHATGPMFGPKMRAAKGRPLELEERALADVGLTPEARAALGRHADGTRRDLMMRPTDVSVTADADGALVLAFFLPSGSYATVLVRELTRVPFLEDGRG